MKRLLLSTLAAAGLMMAGATATQPEALTASIRAEQTAQATDSTSRAPQQGIGQVVQEQIGVSTRAFGESKPFRFFGHTGPRRVKFGRCRWILLS